MVDMLVPPLPLVTTAYTINTNTFPPGLVAGGRAGPPPALGVVSTPQNCPNGRLDPRTQAH